MLKRWEIATILTQVMDHCTILDANGTTVLHALCAASYDQPDPEVLLGLAAVFIGKGCPLDALDHEGTTALHHCVINDQLALAELLLERGANANARIPDSGVAPLIIAALDKNMEMAFLLMHHGADSTLATRDGSTATAIYPQLAGYFQKDAGNKPTPAESAHMLAQN